MSLLIHHSDFYFPSISNQSHRLWVTVFCMRLLYDAFPAIFLQFNPSSTKQHIWLATPPPLESSSPVLNPLFILLKIGFYCFSILASIWVCVSLSLCAIAASVECAVCLCLICEGISFFSSNSSLDISEVYKRTHCKNWGTFPLSE